MPAPHTQEPSPSRGWRWIILPVALFLLSRAAIFTIAGFSLLVDQQFHNPQPPVAGNLVVQGLTRWDGGWFIRIANDGYNEAINTNFFPLFPLMGRYVSAATGLSVAASLVICANVCALFAMIVAYRVFLELEGEAAAAAGLAIWVAWPFSFFQAAAYPESIMMLSTALAIWLAMRKRHLAAGTALGVGILARHLTALGGLSLLAQQIRERGFHPKRLILHRDFLGLLLPPAIVSIYFIFLAHRFGDPLVWLRMRSQWGSSAWWGLRTFITQPWNRTPEITFYVIVAVVPTVGAALLLSRRRWHTLAAFAVGLMLLLWVTGVSGLGRYSSSCWPAFLPLGVWLGRKPAYLAGAVCALGMLQGLMLYLFVHLFPIL